MNRDEITARVRRWTAGTAYKPGWAFELAEHPDGALLLSAVVSLADARRPGMDTVVTGVVALGEKSTSDERAFRHRVLTLIEHLEAHEIREWLTFDGDRTFDPHTVGPVVRG